MTLTTLHFRGDFDFSRKAEIERSLRRAELSDIAVIDLTKVVYFDSSALSALAVLRQRMLANGRAGILRVVISSESQRRIFQICGLDKTFEMYRTLKEAGNGPGRLRASLSQVHAR